MAGLMAALLGACPAGAALLPKGMGWLQPVISSEGREIDRLYLTILWIVIILFVLTQGALLFTILFFRARPGRKAVSVHGSTKAEIIWTLTPALILAILTILSGALWGRIRLNFPTDKEAQVVQVLAEQFQWNFRYPGKDGVFGTADDVVTNNDLHVPLNKKVVLHISSKDVIHSFFQPEARAKQDAVPGLQTRFWFRVDKLCVWDPKVNDRVFLSQEDFEKAKVAMDGYDFIGTKVSDNGLKTYKYELKDPKAKTVTISYQGKTSQAPPSEVQYIYHPLEIGCAQLCGTLHFGMRGEVRIQTPEQFDAWMASAPANPAASKKFTEIWDKNHPDFNKPSL
jgi:heme/copper-type cytochrome/quinol oxidase subunit 2